MSAFIGSVNGPHHNSTSPAFAVECSAGGVEVYAYDSFGARYVCRNLDPIGARNFAALLVRASEEAERMADARWAPTTGGPIESTEGSPT